MYQSTTFQKLRLHSASVFLFLLGCDAGLISRVVFIQWVERGTVRVKCTLTNRSLHPPIKHSVVEVHFSCILRVILTLPLRLRTVPTNSEVFLPGR